MCSRVRYTQLRCVAPLSLQLADLLMEGESGSGWICDATVPLYLVMSPALL